MTATGSPAGGYRFRHVARMEWIKLRTLPSTWLTLALTVVGAVGIAIAVGVNTKNPAGDLTNNVLAGVAPGLLLTGVLGVLMMTNEFTSGMIRTTLVAAPKRPRLLAAKAAVFGSVALVVGELASSIAFLVGRLALPRAIPGPALGQPGVLRAVVLSGLGYSLIGLIGLGLGAAIRHTAAAVAALVGGVYVLAQAVGGLSTALRGYLPVSIVANSLSAVNPSPDRPSPWTGLGVLCLYAAAALAAGGKLLVRRDV